MKTRRVGRGLISAAASCVLGLTLALATMPSRADLAYISNEGSGYGLAIADTSTNAVLGNIPVSNLPGGVAVSPDGSRAYVGTADSTLDVVDTATRTVIAQLFVLYPITIAVSPDGKRVYASGAGGGVSVIDATTNTVTQVVQTGLSVAAHFGMTKDGTKLVVSDEDYSGSSIAVINTASLTVTQIPVPGLGRCDGVAMSPTTSRAYVACGGVVQIVDLTANAVVGTIQSLPGATYGVISADGKTLYLSGLFSNAVYVIDLASNTLRAQFAYNAPLGLALSSDGKTLFIGSTGQLAVGEFDTTSLASTGSIPVGGSLYIALTAGTTPFSKFSPTVILAPKLKSFSVAGTFTLGSSASALTPKTQAVTLALGALTLTIPAGALQQPNSKVPLYTYTGTVNGVKLAVLLDGQKLGPYTVSITGVGYDFTGATNPFPVSLTVGNNKGSTTVNPVFLSKLLGQ